jgi:alpha/beta superfamily hydrolase
MNQTYPTQQSADDRSGGMIHFIHGKESGPRGGKILAMSEVARQAGWATESLDYSGSIDPAVRLVQLLSHHGSSGRPLVLVGSSMGGWVAGEASRALNPVGIFLLAPAFGRSQYPTRGTCSPTAVTEIVHGWDDDVIPPAQSIDFAKEHACTLHLVPGDHRLEQALPELCGLFEQFLKRLSRL